MDDADAPIPLCERCGEALGRSGTCPACGHDPRARGTKKKRRKKSSGARTSGGSRRPERAPAEPARAAKKRPSIPDLDESQIIELDSPQPKKRRPKAEQRKPSGEDEFWEFSDLSVD